MRKYIIITISENYLDKLNSIADFLRKEGLLITQLYEFGVITGSCEEENIEKLKDHKEIISFAEDTPASIAPPDEDVQ